MTNVHQFPRHGQPGYYALADLPQRESVFKSSFGVGWADTMDKLLRLYPGQFIVTTGKAGSGKSTFWLNIVCNLAHDYNYGSFLYVPENEGHIVAKLERIWGVRRGWDAFRKEFCLIQSAQPEHYDAEPKTLQWVLMRAATAIEKDGVRLILIDPWNELERARPKDMTMTDYIANCLMFLTKFARHYGVSVCVINHPTKDSLKDGKIPKLSDCEGSLAWENKCDNGLIVHREIASTQVISAKVREKGGGWRGACVFAVDEDSEQFTPTHVDC